MVVVMVTWQLCALVCLSMNDSNQSCNLFHSNAAAYDGLDGNRRRRRRQTRSLQKRDDRRCPRRLERGAERDDDDDDDDNSSLIQNPSTAHPTSW